MNVIGRMCGTKEVSTRERNFKLGSAGWNWLATAAILLALKHYGPYDQGDDVLWKVR